MQDFDFWMKQDLPIVENSDCVFVISKDKKWRESKGVCREVSLNCEINNKFFVFSPDQILSGDYEFVLNNYHDYGMSKTLNPNRGAENEMQKSYYNS